MSIDWTKPLELMDGTPVVLSPEGGLCGNNPDLDGDYWVVREDGVYLECRCVNDLGHDFHDNDYIRNRKEPTA